MQNNSLRRIMSALLTLVLVVCTILSDLVLPDKAGLFTKEVSAAEYLRGTLGITSDYIKNHLNEAAADQVAFKEDGGILQKVFGEVTAYADDTPVFLNGEYDENGLGLTYHYILLNYSLAESSVCYPGVTVSDIWNNHPESFIANINAYTNVYAVEGEDYFVAFVNPGAINTMGAAVSADFTDGNNENPTIYNDTISFDAAAGMIYIPKSFYFDAEGQEIIRNLTAQVLVPYTFKQNNSSLYQLIVENEQPGIVVPETVSARVGEPFDVEMSFPIATPETAALVDASKIRVYLNDDAALLNTGSGDVFYDSATGYLTIGQSASTVYSVKVVIGNEVITAQSSEILVAATDGFRLSGNIMRTESSALSSPAQMLEASWMTVKVDSSALGLTYQYNAPIVYPVNPYNTEAWKQTFDAVAGQTYSYCYYWNKAQGDDWSNSYIRWYDNATQKPVGYDTMTLQGMIDGMNALPAGEALKSGLVHQTNLSGRDIIDTYLFDMMFGSPDLDGTDDNFTSLGNDLQGNNKEAQFKFSYSSAIGTNATHGGSTKSFLIAHCAHGITSYHSVLNNGNTNKIYMRILHLDTENKYAVLGFSLPIQSTTDGQSGFAMYRVGWEDDTERYYSSVSITKTETVKNNEYPSAIYMVSDSQTSVTNELGASGSVPSGANYASFAKSLARLGTIEAYDDTATTHISYVSTSGNATAAKLNKEFQYESNSVPASMYLYVKEAAVSGNYEVDPYLYRFTVTPSLTSGGSTVTKVERLEGSTWTATNKLTNGVAAMDDRAVVSHSVEKAYSGATGTSDLVKNITVQLKQNGSDYGAAVKLTNAPSFAYTWNNLPKYDTSGTAYTYTVVETKVNDIASPSTYFTISYNNNDTSKTVITNSQSTTHSFIKAYSGNYAESYVDSITVQLTRNGSAYGSAVTLTNKSENFAHTWNNLEKYYWDANSSSFKEYTYSVNETAVNGNSSVDTYYTVTKNEVTTLQTKITNTSVETSHSFIKAFAGNYAESYVNSITVQLTRNGSAYGDPVTLTNKSENFAYTWTGLAKYDKNRNSYTYSVNEVAVNGNTNVSDYYVVTKDEVSVLQTKITNQSTEVTHSFIKAYSGAYAEDYIDSITVQLTRNGSNYGDAVTLTNKAENFAHTWTGLAKYDAGGNAYTYSVKEVAVNGNGNVSTCYTITTVETTSILTTITNASVETEHSVAKTYTGSDIESITWILTQNGSDYTGAGATVTRTKDEGFSYTWTALPKFDAAGNAYTYSVKEAAVNGVADFGEYFTTGSSESSDGLTTSKTNEDKTTTHNFVKDFAGSYAKSYVSSVTVQLTQDGTDYGEPVTLTNKTENFAHTWTNLPAYHWNGTEFAAYTYSVREVAVNGSSDLLTDYTITTVDDTSTLTTTITNMAKTVTHSFLKAYSGDYAESYIESITVQLYRNGAAYKDPVTLTNKTENYAHTWTNLPKYDASGNLYTYTVNEAKVNDKDGVTTYYIVTNEETTSTLTTITNESKTTQYSFIKEMDDETKSVVTSVSATLYRQIAGGDAQELSTIVLDVTANDTATWSNLPVYDASGNLYTYTARETSVTITAGEQATVYTGDQIDTYFKRTTTDTAAVIAADGSVETAGKTVVKNEIKPPEGYTTARDEATGTKTVSHGETVKVVDRIYYRGLIPGKSYSVTGTLMVKETQQPLKDAEGNEITASATLVATSSDEGYVEIVFEFDSTLLKDEEKTLVAFETIEEGDKEVISFKEFDDTEETVYKPSIGTTLVDATTGDHITAYSETAYELIDTVAYKNLTVLDEDGEEITYKMVGYLYLPDGVALTDAQGNKISAEATFKPEHEDGAITGSGTVNVVFNIDAAVINALEGKTITCFEYLYLVKISGEETEDKLVAEHAEYTEDQSIRVPEVRTTAKDATKGGHESSYGTETKYVDIVTYKGLIADGRTYTVSGTLMNKSTESELLDAKGEPITASKTFIPETPDGTVELEFTVDSTLLEGEHIVVFEDVSWEGITVGVHRDLNDKDQEIVVPHYSYVEVHKTDEDGVAREGVKYDIVRKDTGALITTLTTDKDGHAKSDLIQVDEVDEANELQIITYTIQEVYAPAGLVLNEEIISFNFLDTEGKVLKTKTNDMINDIQRGRIAVLKKGLAAVGIEEVETKYGITVNKLVFDYIYLKDVEFTIYEDEECTKEVGKVVTDGSGWAYSEELKVGTYFIKETKTPENYAKDDTVNKFIITGVAQEGKSVEYVLDVTKDIENKLLSSKLEITKVGTDASGKEVPLAGVVFGVFAAEDIKSLATGEVVVPADSCIALIKTGKDGLATLTECLPSGKYYYRELETANDKYILDEKKYEFEVKLDKEDDQEIVITKKNINDQKSGTLTIYKVDQDGNKLGAGVEFRLWCLDGDKEIKTYDLVTNSDSIASLTGLPLGYYNEDGEMVYYTYKLQETKTWDRYKMSTETYEWKFEDGVTDAEAVYVSYTIKNILGIEDYTMMGGIGMLLLAFGFIVLAFKKRRA